MQISLIINGSLLKFKKNCFCFSGAHVSTNKIEHHTKLPVKRKRRPRIRKRQHWHPPQRCSSFKRSTPFERYPSSERSPSSQRNPPQRNTSENFQIQPSHGQRHQRLLREPEHGLHQEARERRVFAGRRHQSPRNNQE